MHQLRLRSPPFNAMVTPETCAAPLVVASTAPFGPNALMLNW